MRSSKTKQEVFNLHVTTVGILFGSLFAILSLTPTLLPRTWLFQGVAVGVTFAFGYGVGNALAAIYRYFDLKEPKRATKQKLIKGLFSLIAIAAAVMLYQSVAWNNTLLEIVGSETNSGVNAIGIFFIAAVIAYLILIIARSLRKFVRWVRNWALKVMPKKLAVFIGSVAGIFLLFTLANGVLTQFIMKGVNNVYSLQDITTDAGVTQPETPLRSGGPESLISWESLGRQGRNFTAGGPTVDEITDFQGDPAKQPIRVYAGLKSADSIEERSQLVLDELKRTRAFEREALVLATTTGTGWLDPGAVDTIEYIHGGDTAIAGIQYSYLPSVISLFADQQITKDTARIMLNTVHDYWRTLDEADRPSLYLFGLSLGSYGSLESASSLRLMNDPVDGALWVGTPFVSNQWKTLTAARDEGSPAWRPIVDNGRVVRSTGASNVLNDFDQPWEGARYAFLQHASDPITFFSVDSLYRSPEWLEDRSPNISPDMRWIPGVTMWQVAVDMPAAGAAPKGHGHNYSPSTYIDAWASVTDVTDWDDKKANQLKQIFAPN